MEKNVKIAKELVKLAKMLCADENYVQNFLRNFNYADPNSDFTTEVVSCKGNELVFKVVILPEKVAVETTVTLEGDENGMNGKAVTKWAIDYKYYKNNFNPDLTPKEVELSGTEEEIKKQISDNVLLLTKTVKLKH